MTKEEFIKLFIEEFEWYNRYDRLGNKRQSEEALKSAKKSLVYLNNDGLFGLISSIHCNGEIDVTHSLDVTFFTEEDHTLSYHYHSVRLHTAIPIELVLQDIIKNERNNAVICLDNGSMLDQDGRNAGVYVTDSSTIQAEQFNEELEGILVGTDQTRAKVKIEI